jgi:heme/copper-type cytochrome/quinol oxidase subunit 2
MAQIRGFEVYTLWFIIPITLFVLGLLIYVMVKFRAGANPTPSKTSHNTPSRWSGRSARWSSFWQSPFPPSIC